MFIKATKQAPNMAEFRLHLVFWGLCGQARSQWILSAIFLFDCWFQHTHRHQYHWQTVLHFKVFSVPHLCCCWRQLQDLGHHRPYCFLQNH